MTVQRQMSSDLRRTCWHRGPILASLSAQASALCVEEPANDLVERLRRL